MKFITQEQERVFNRLVKLAHGDTMLVESALRKYGSNDESATLSQVIQFIKAETEQHETAGAA